LRPGCSASCSIGRAPAPVGRDAWSVSRPCWKERRSTRLIRVRGLAAGISFSARGAEPRADCRWPPVMGLCDEGH
jgi:hypothetical protein